jgi:hypothetical protein
MATGQTTMVGGPVEYKRKYTLWILVVLIILCWPIAIIYYFTREKVPVQEFQAYATAPPPVAPLPATAGGERFCPACGASNSKQAGFCRSCGKPLPTVPP